MNRRVPLIAGVVLVAIIAIWFVGVWKPASARLTKAQAAKAAAVVRQDDLDGQLATLIRLQRALPATEASLRGSEQALPTTLSISSVIDQIQKIALANGILWTNESQSLSSASASATSSSSPTADSSSSTAGSDATSTAVGNSTLSLTMTVAGSYSSMSRFITQFEELPRLVVIDTLGYTPQGGDDVEVKVGARAFYDTSPLPKLPATVPAG